MLRINSEILFTLVVGIVLLVILGTFIVVFLLGAQKKKFFYKRQLDKFQQTLLQSQLEIQEQTLQHISQELHDNLGHTASIIKINLNTLRLDDEEKAKEKIEDTKELTRLLITDLKALSVSLGGDRVAQTGLIKAIDTEIARLNKTGQFTANFEQQGNIPLIDKDKSVILYRMVQEVLNNMVKHSGAKHIHVLLSGQENLITLVLTDDGNGFNVDEKMNSGGAGLHNLQKRAQLINAALTLTSTPGNGTTVSIALPL